MRISRLWIFLTLILCACQTQPLGNPNSTPPTSTSPSESQTTETPHITSNPSNQARLYIKINQWASVFEFHPDGNHIVIPYISNSQTNDLLMNVDLIMLENGDTATLTTIINSEPGFVSTTVLDISSDGRWVAAGTSFGEIYLWDLERQSIFDVLHIEEAGSISELEFSPDSEWLTFAYFAARGESPAGYFGYTKLEDTSIVYLPTEFPFVSDIEFSKDGKTFTTANGIHFKGAGINTWNTETCLFQQKCLPKLELFKVEGFGPFADYISLSPDNRFVAATVYDPEEEYRKLRIMDLETQMELTWPSSDTTNTSIGRIEFSSQGILFIQGDTIRLIEPISGNFLDEFEYTEMEFGIAGPYWKAFTPSPDGQLLIINMGSEGLEVWELPHYQLQSTTP